MPARPTANTPTPRRLPFNVRSTSREFQMLRTPKCSQKTLFSFPARSACGNGGDPKRNRHRLDKIRAVKISCPKGAAGFTLCGRTAFPEGRRLPPFLPGMLRDLLPDLIRLGDRSFPVASVTIAVDQYSNKERGTSANNRRENNRDGHHTILLRSHLKL
jgi:hypothetical protein